MRTNKEFEYYLFEIGNYVAETSNKKTFKPYKADTKKLIWNIFNEENGKIEVINLFEYNWVFLWEGLLYAKKHYAEDFPRFADHVRNWLRHEYWSRSEYETIVTSWPAYITQEEIDRLNKEEPRQRKPVNLEVGYKLDIYAQVMINWDRFIDYVWTNKKLITKKKLGLARLG